MQWLQNSNQKNADSLNNVRREASRHFRNKKKEHLKTKIDKLETNSEIKNMTDLYRVKVKFSRCRPGVAQSVGRGITLLFHDCGTRRG